MRHRGRDKAALGKGAGRHLTVAVGGGTTTGGRTVSGRSEVSSSVPELLLPATDLFPSMNIPGCAAAAATGKPGCAPALGAAAGVGIVAGTMPAAGKP